MNSNSEKKYINPFRLFVGSFIPNWLLKRAEVSQGAKLCYARLAQYAGQDGECFPSQATLASEIGAGERQVRRYITELEAQGLIEIVHVGLNRSNRYLFLWHVWMEDEKEMRKEPPGNGKKGKNHPDRTHMSVPERTEQSHQERPSTSVKEDQVRDSFKTTTRGVVVDEGQITKIKKALAPDYLEIPDSVIADLITKKGIEHVLSTAAQAAYQIEFMSEPLKNPTGHFRALTLRGMNRPYKYESPEEKAQDEKAAIMRAGHRRKKSLQDRKERIPREQLREFIELLTKNNDGA